MKAVALKRYLPIVDPESLLDVDLPRPSPPQGHDLLVAVKAISVNPVDVKRRAPKSDVEREPGVLGWDAAGVVEAVGEACTLFKPGDEVFYAGSIARPGTNAEYQLVDERIVGPKPETLNFAQAAALPLTSLTAWELLFERMGVALDKTAPQGRLLVIGGAGGVGSIAIQLARRLTALHVIATASRPETVEWCKQMGAHEVVDHRKALAQQVSDVSYVLSLTATEQHYADVVELLAPEGHLGIIDDPKTVLDVRLLKRKSLSLHWEFMFTRAVYGTPTLTRQHHILSEVARLVDEGVLRSTVTEDLGPICAANLKKAHAQIESGRTRGKLVLSGF
ncbi:MAG: zinc-binding alcohol dehydrogenase family protein [Archangiaceae bacterium]|nr:zinc-binding alcohol dehydrogenase family protein [Archangiaceae bacterium]